MDFAVFGILEIEDKIVLVQEKGKFPEKKWKLPGGRPKGDETEDIVLMREMADEVGIVIEQPQDDDLLAGKHKPKREGNGSYKVLFYGVKYYSGEPKSGVEIERVGLFTGSQIESMIKEGKILPDHAEALLVYLKKRAVNLS